EAVRRGRNQPPAAQVRRVDALSRMAARTRARRARTLVDAYGSRAARLPSRRAVRAPAARRHVVRRTAARRRRRRRLAPAERAALGARAALYPLSRRLRGCAGAAPHARRMSAQTRVAIVGGGPAGSLLAILLARRGL